MCGDARATWEDADASLYRSTYKFEMSQQIEVARMVETMDKQGGQEVGGRDGHTFQGRTHGWVRRRKLLHQRRRQRRGETSAEKVITHFSFLFR
jgi:hypothetical protein